LIIHFKNKNREGGGGRGGEELEKAMIRKMNKVLWLMI